jgi:hypothetical protein
MHMVTSMDLLREQIRAACEQHDRMMAEHAQWQAEREALASPPVRENEPDGILYRTHGDNATLPISEPDAVALFGDERDEILCEGIGQALAHERARARAERVELDRQIATLEGEIRELRGMLGATLALLGAPKERFATALVNPEADADKIIDLPDWRARRDAA